jgi:hypothetical protein
VIQHRKNLTKLQAHLFELAKDSLNAGASFSQTADRLIDALAFYKSQNPKYRGQTYVSYFSPDRWTTGRESVHICDAGGDVTLISIYNEKK